MAADDRAMSRAAPLLPGSTSARQPPVNLTAEDQGLFAPALAYQAPAMTVSAHPGAVITPRGEAFQGLNVLPCTFAMPDGHGARNRMTYWYRAGRALIRPEPLDGDGFFATDQWSRNYFHWLSDAGQRLEAAVRHLPRPLPPLLLPARMAANGPVVQSLEAWPEFRIRILPPRPVRLRGTLHALSPAARPGDYRDDLIRAVGARYRRHFAPDADAGPGRRIYISRARAPTRRVLNEDDITGLMIDRGFEIHHFDGMGFADQVRLMGEASVLASVHGAGLTNMLFMPEGGRVLELRRRGDDRNNAFFALAGALGHAYAYALSDAPGEMPLKRDGTPHFRKNKDRDVRVDPGAVDDALDALLG